MLITCTYVRHLHILGNAFIQGNLNAIKKQEGVRHLAQGGLHRLWTLGIEPGTCQPGVNTP